MADLARRQLLAGGGALAAAGPVLARPAAETDGLDLTSAAGRLHAFMLMRGAFDEGVIASFFSGMYYGVVDGDPQPLYGLTSATLSRYRRLDDGSYRIGTFEQSYFTDLDSGKVMEHWRNPYTGETVEVPLARYPGRVFTVGTDLSFARPPQPGTAFAHRILPIRAIGPDVWIVEETISRSGPPEAPTRYSEIITMRADRAALAGPGAKRAATYTTAQSVASWRPWLKMGSQPGHQMGNMEGRSHVPFEALPPVWLEASARFRPEVMRDPGALTPPV